MHERPPSLSLPYQLPTLEAVQMRIEALGVQATERRELEYQLLELEQAANELRSRLGRDTIEPTVHVFERSPELRDAYKARQEQEANEAKATIGLFDIPLNTPITIKRQHYVDHDLAGGYTVYTNFGIQKSNDLIFIEESTVTSDQNREAQTIQYIAGEGLAYPLTICKPTSQVAEGIFVLSDSEGCDWTEFGYDAEDAYRELCSERLIQETLAVVEDQPILPGRYSDELQKTARVEVSDCQSMEVVATYYEDYADGRQRELYLAHVAVIEYVGSERVAMNRLDTREGDYNFIDFRSTGTYEEKQQNAMNRFKNSLGIVKALLSQESN